MIWDIYLQVIVWIVEPAILGQVESFVYLAQKRERKRGPDEL